MRLVIAILAVMHSFAAYSLELEDNAATVRNLSLTPVAATQTSQASFAKLAIDTSYTSNADIQQLLVAPLEISNESFHFSGQLTIHKTDNFNIAMTANHNPELNNQSTSLSQHLNHKQLSIEQQNTSHYGLVGSYLLTPSWQVSGGIVHSVPTTELNRAYQGENTNSIALIGTSYSF